MNVARRYASVALCFALTASGFGCGNPGSGGFGLPLPPLPDTVADGVGDTDDGSADVPVVDTPTPDIQVDAPTPDTQVDAAAPDIGVDVPMADTGVDVPMADTGVDVAAPDIGVDVPAVDVPSDTSVGPVTMTIPKIQQAGEGTGCDSTAIVPGINVTIVGAVVTSPVSGVSATLSSVYVAHPGGTSDWGGLLIVGETGLFPDLSPGAVVTLAGRVDEYFCNTQLEVTQITVTGSASVPAPKAISAGAEEQEGMLVTVQNVNVIQEVDAGVFEVEGGLLIGHDFNFFLSMSVGEPYTVTGQLKWAYEAWHLMPRTEADVVFLGTLATKSIADVQQSDASVNCISLAAETIETALVVDGTVSAARWDVSASLHGYHITTGPSPYQSVTVVVSANLLTDFAVGDRVRVTGDHVEYYCMTQLQATSMELLGTEAAPSPASLLVTDFAAAAESWEGGLVSLAGLVVQDGNMFGDVDTTTTIGEEPLIIDDDLMGDLTAPLGGTTVHVIGVIRYAYDAYRISPRDSADLVSGF